MQTEIVNMQLLYFNKVHKIPGHCNTEIIVRSFVCR